MESKRTSLNIPPLTFLSNSDGFSASSSRSSRNETLSGRSASTSPRIEHTPSGGAPDSYDLSLFFSTSPRERASRGSFSATSTETDSARSFSTSPHRNMPCDDIVIANLDDFKRELQINSQCQDPHIVQIGEIEKKLDHALELKSRGQLDQARMLYSEIVDSCEKSGITDLKEPILREAVWGLQTNCQERRSNDIMVAASSRPGRVAAQHQLGLIYSEGENKDELVACDLLQNAADKNYAPAISSLVSLANQGSSQAEKCLLKLIEKRELASQIIEMQLNVDIEDEYLRKQIQQAVVEGKNGNKHAIDLLKEYEQKNKKFALYFFAEQTLHQDVSS
jgi:hypothetical protein